MKRIRVGVLGVSKHFLKRIVLPLQSSDWVELYAIGSRNGGRSIDVANSFGFTKGYSSYLEVLNDENVDLVYIPLPNSLHLEFIKLAADRNKAILCEKPIGLNSLEAIEAANYCKALKIPLLEGFMYKFHPQWIHTKDYIRSQQLGQIQHISITFSNMNLDGNNIRNKPEFGGGALMDVGCYALSVPMYLLDMKPLRVISLMEIDSKFGVDSLTSGVLDFGKTRCTFNVSTQSDSYQRVEIVGSAGSITITLPFNVYNDVPSSIIISTPLGQRTVSFPICDQYKLMFEAFAKHLLGVKHLHSNCFDVVDNMIVLDSIRKSSVDGGWVEVK